MSGMSNFTPVIFVGHLLQTVFQFFKMCLLKKYCTEAIETTCKQLAARPVVGPSQYAPVSFMC